MAADSLALPMGSASADLSLLLVEDEPLTGMALLADLEEHGYRVNLCATGFDALNFIDMEESIDTVVTDIRLENGPDGWEIARRARDQFPNSTVIYITGSASDEYVLEGVPESHILKKPFKISDLVKLISTLRH
jgi:DNA-binding response OmpR family regulator